MFDKMKQLYEMQRKAKDLQRQLENTRVEKSGADGLVKVSVNGAHQLVQLSIDPALLAPEKKNLLEQALTRTLNDAFTDVQKQAAAQAAGLMKEFDLPGLH